ncbi:hypothetical protein Trco_008219 [Trichoderma cornu-damae]|uniref:Uncharacterized protein n=1 Tax=Trichoderma cornu-damae TaxID=654480 RepID=A0A9P8TTU8_9HYPO|nr:hypothetical protein Trco_008219 [Trichoderma cornu-damae]
MTVAPGCVGSRLVKGLGLRCNLDELALYIGNARFDTGEFLNGGVDVGKLKPGKADFYEALSSMGDPIGTLAAEVDKREKANMDKYRRLFFEKYFKGDFEDGKSKLEIVMKDVDTPMQNKNKPTTSDFKKKASTLGHHPQTVRMIDIEETINRNKGKIESFEERLLDANEKFMAIEKDQGGERVKINEQHKKAYVAAKAAAAAAGCTRELPRDLKKRNPQAESFPKAAKSIRVKARKLGFTV